MYVVQSTVRAAPPTGRAYRVENPGVDVGLRSLCERVDLQLINPVDALLIVMRLSTGRITLSKKAKLFSVRSDYRRLGVAWSTNAEQ
jgi:hypothetical protein